MADTNIDALPAFTGALVGTNGLVLYDAAGAGALKTKLVTLATFSTWYMQRASTVTALAAGATVNIDLAVGDMFTLTANQNFTLANPTNIEAGRRGSLRITQDATGNRVVTWGSAYLFPGGVEPTLSTAAGAVDLLQWVTLDGSTLLCNLVKAFG